jgi:pilus assembly protein CpaB
MDKRLVTVILMAVAVALVITAIFYQITVGRKPVEAEVPTRELVVAKAEMPMGSVITTENIRVIDFPEQAYPDGGFGAIEQVVDRTVMQHILANEPIVSGKVTDKGAGYGLAPLIPEGQRAMAIAVNQVSGVSGYILPGSTVDILLTGAPPGQEDRMTTTVLEKVTILSTGHQQRPDASGQPQNVPVVNVLVTPEQAELLTLATREGSVQLILRNPIDEAETADKRPGIRTRDLYAKTRPDPPARGPRPQPRVVVRTAPPPPPPPPPVTVEMIRGNSRSVETLANTSN